MGEIYSKKEVGNRLRDIRCKLDLTQEQFAEILDISPQLYKKMESGENNISLNTQKKKNLQKYGIRLWHCRIWRRKFC